MATRTVKVSDLTGEEGDVQTVKIVDPSNNRTYQIDLTGKEVDGLIKQLSKYLQAARPATDTTPARRTANRTSNEAAAVRQWAEHKQLIKPGGRGRIPQTVWDQYAQATSGKTSDAT